MEENLRGLVSSNGIWGDVESIAALGIHSNKSRSSIGVGSHGRIKGNRVGFTGFGRDSERGEGDIEKVRLGGFAFGELTVVL